MQWLTPEKARIFRATHIDNMPWILDHGLYCQSAAVTNPEFRPIGHPDIILKRTRRIVPIEPHGVLSDYVPFYFTPRSPMLYNILTGFGGLQQIPAEEIVILVTSLHAFAQHDVRFVFTDRHAYLQAARFFNALEDLEQLDWRILRASDFCRAPNDPGKMERYQAEALVYHHLPVTLLQGIACFDAEGVSTLQAEVGRRGLSVPVRACPRWYFR